VKDLGTTRSAITLNYVPDPGPAKRGPLALFAPLPVATGTGQNQVVIERLAAILFIGASIPWDWY
jgi:hypothetical protein